MFTWICPKCGKEVPPSYSACPTCDVTEQAVPVDQSSAPAVAPPRPPATPAARVRQRRSGVPGWLLSIGFAVLFVGAGLGAFLLFRGSHERPAAARPAVALETPGEQTAAAQKINPAFKHVELAGLRLTQDRNRKAQLQFVAVNHSGADLGELAAKVILKSAKAGPADPPLGTFTLKTSLGPYEAKDLKVPVDTALRVYELPDWQFLRAEIAAQ